MGELSDRLDEVRVRASLTTGALVADLVHRDQVEIRFAQGYYRRATERELERHLEQLARLLCARRNAEYYAAWSELAGERITGERAPIGHRDRDFVAARAELVAQGWSTDERVRIFVRGMSEWDVQIEPGTLDALTEAEFADAIREAAAALITDQLDQTRTLAAEIYV